MPAAAAARRVGTTPRRSASNTIAAPTRTTYCQGSLSARARVMAEPAMAPMAAGPAPSRKARALRWRAIGRSGGPPSRTNAKDGLNATATASRPPREPGGGVADDRDGLHDGSGGDLAEGDGVEELRAGHPVVVVDGVGLHERDDHEAAAVGQRADLERHPGHRGQHADAERAESPASGTGTNAAAGVSRRTRAVSLDCHRRRAGRARPTAPIGGGREDAGDEVADPAQHPGSAGVAGALPAGRHQAGRGVHRHRGDRGTGARSGGEDPARRVPRPETARPGRG